MSIRKRSKRLLIALGAGTLLASSGLVVSASVAAQTEDEPRQQRNAVAKRPAGSLDWAPCEAQNLAGLECATLQVPLNYDEPDGQTIEVAVSRLASANPQERRGVLLTNPGGPGGAGRSMPLLLAQAGMPASVLDSYDIIGFDPRGIEQSTPVTCGWNQQDLLNYLPTHAAGPQDVAEREQTVQALGEKCANADNNGVLPHVNTPNTARDMDQIREALGEEKVSYFGVSYGSYLGAVYAQLFPQRSDRILLDSVIGPEMVWRDEFRLFGLGAELRFPDFAKWAAARDATYELGETPKQVRATFQRLAGQLDEEPVQGVDGTLFRWQVFNWTYADAQFPALAQFMQAVDRADGETAEQLLAEHTERAESRSRAQQQLPPDHYQAAQNAVLCNDVAWPDSVAHYQRAVQQDSKRFPLVGSVMGNMWTCAGWSLGQVEEPVRIDDSVSSEVLLLQNVRDPATTYPGAVQMRAAMGDRSRLVTVDDGGHGVFVLGDNACGNNVATAFLVDGEMPDGDEFCAANTDPTAAPFRNNPDRKEAVLDFHARNGLVGLATQSR